MANMSLFRFSSELPGFSEKTIRNVEGTAFNMESNEVGAVLGSFQEFTESLRSFVQDYLYKKGTSADRVTVNNFLTEAWEKACEQNIVLSGVRYLRSTPTEVDGVTKIVEQQEEVKIVGIRYNHPKTKTAHFEPVWEVSHDKIYPGVAIDGHYIGTAAGAAYYLCTNETKQHPVILEFWLENPGRSRTVEMKATYITPRFDFRGSDRRTLARVLWRAEAMGLLNIKGITMPPLEQPALIP